MATPELQQQLVELAATGKVTVAGAGTGFIGWLFSSQAVGLLGVGIAFCGALMQFYFLRKRDKREVAEHEARMKALE